MNKKVKKSKEKYMVKDKEAKIIDVKANKTDIGGNFYVYDLYDANDTIIALNRYVYKNSDEQPFEELTIDEELILNPPYVEPVEMI